jgi:hypothetical protein
LVQASRLKAVAVVISYDFSTPGSPENETLVSFSSGELIGLRRGSSSFLIPFALALLTTSQTTLAAATSPAPQSQTLAGCGATIEDNLAAAQKAMQSDEKATRAALACLIEATATLNRQVQNLDQGRSPAGALRVPTMTFPPARDQ